MNEPSPLVKYYQLIRQCGCGSGLISEWYKNQKLVDVKACDKCKHKLLYEIFNDKYLDFFENWLGGIFNETNPGWEWVWEDFLKEKNCTKIKEVKGEKGKILIEDPHAKENYILVPEEYAEIVLRNGKMI